MRPGDYVAFPAGQKVGHSFMNSGTGPCRYLMIGEQSPNEVCVYPDSNKVMVRALRSEADIFDMAGVRRYWDGDELTRGRSEVERGSQTNKKAAPKRTSALHECGQTPSHLSAARKLPHSEVHLQHPVPCRLTCGFWACRIGRR